MKIKFNDIAINSVAKKNPVPEDAEHYIGLEHIDSGSFKISRWGSAVAPIGDKLLMKKGDVLFGKRRAYQRKVAIAPFDGIFSAHGMVLRPKTDVVDERYFPFFIASDQFMDEAVRISVGGLSPTINWKTLKECEFDLPPIEEQRALAENLWAANDLKEKYQNLLAATDEMLKAKFREMFGECGGQSAECGVVPLKDVCAILTDGTHQPPKFSDSGIPFLLVSNIKDFELTYDTDKFVTEKQYAELNKRTPVAKGDVLLSVVGSFGNPALVKEDRPFCFQRHIAYLKPNCELVVSEYLYFVLLADSVQKQFGIVAKGCAQKTITLTDLKAVTVPLPPLDLQREFVAIANAAEASKAELKKSMASIDAVMRGLING